MNWFGQFSLWQSRRVRCHGSTLTDMSHVKSHVFHVAQVASRKAVCPVAFATCDLSDFIAMTFGFGSMPFRFCERVQDMAATLAQRSH